MCVYDPSTPEPEPKRKKQPIRLCLSSVKSPLRYRPPRMVVHRFQVLWIHRWRWRVARTLLPKSRLHRDLHHLPGLQHTCQETSLGPWRRLGPDDTTRKHLGIIRKLSTPLNRPLAQEALRGTLSTSGRFCDTFHCIGGRSRVAAVVACYYPLPAFRVEPENGLAGWVERRAGSSSASACRCRDDHPLEPVVRRKPCP